MSPVAVDTDASGSKLSLLTLNSDDLPVVSMEEHAQEESESPSQSTADVKDELTDKRGSGSFVKLTSNEIHNQLRVLVQRLDRNAFPNLRHQTQDAITPESKRMEEKLAKDSSRNDRRKRLSVDDIATNLYPKLRSSDAVVHRDGEDTGELRVAIEVEDEDTSDAAVSTLTTSDHGRKDGPDEERSEAGSTDKDGSSPDGIGYYQMQLR